ncbi:hypothetical protein SAMN05444144_10455 [Flavobacterium akiainvivens]|nr:hypothetical protein SAMN05444144_10455 [Flavobacterium akiainvivens]
MNDKTTSWKKSYSLVLLLNVIYIVVFYFIMQIYT